MSASIQLRADKGKVSVSMEDTGNKPTCVTSSVELTPDEMPTFSVFVELFKSTARGFGFAQGTVDKLICDVPVPDGDDEGDWATVKITREETAAN